MSFPKALSTSYTSSTPTEKQADQAQKGFTVQQAAAEWALKRRGS